eukprot:1686728-Rhodomonas_salina.1
MEGNERIFPSHMTLSCSLEIQNGAYRLHALLQNCHTWGGRKHEQLDWRRLAVHPAKHSSPQACITHVGGTANLAPPPRAGPEPAIRCQDRTHSRSMSAPSPANKGHGQKTRIISQSVGEGGH